MDLSSPWKDLSATTSGPHRLRTRAKGVAERARRIADPHRLDRARGDVTEPSVYHYLDDCNHDRPYGRLTRSRIPPTSLGRYQGQDEISATIGTTR
jgi:hypothetical protein